MVRRQHRDNHKEIQRVRRRHEDAQQQATLSLTCLLLTHTYLEDESLPSQGEGCICLTTISLRGDGTRSRDC